MRCPLVGGRALEVTDVNSLSISLSLTDLCLLIADVKLVSFDVCSMADASLSKINNSSLMPAGRDALGRMAQTIDVNASLAMSASDADANSTNRMRPRTPRGHVIVGMPLEIRPG